MVKVRVYLCFFKIEQQLVSRHYAAHISVCELLRECEDKELELAEELLTKIRRGEEVVITEKPFIRGMIGRSVDDDYYLRLVPLSEHS